jgi:hypothetical protein
MQQLRERQIEKKRLQDAITLSVFNQEKENEGSRPD